MATLLASQKLAVPPSALSPEEIARRAYEKWIARGGIHDTQCQDWFEAESELQAVHDLARQVAALEGTLANQMKSISELERRLGTEHAISGILARSSTLAGAASEILRTICECLDWDAGVFWRLDRKTNLLGCIQVWHSEAIAMPAFERLSCHFQFPPGIGLPGRVWACGKLQWIPDVASDPNFPRLSTAKQEGLRGAVGFPIRCGTEFLGVMEFFSREVRQPDEPIIDMMSSIGHQLGQFIERGHAVEELCRQAEDRRLAREIQQGLLPRRPPQLAGFAIASALSTTAEVGGDGFDFLSMRFDDREVLGVLVADASGHGIAAALLIAETLAYIRGLSLTCANVGMLLTLVNRCLSDEIVADSFVSALLVQLDPRTRVLRYASAGHPAGVVFDRHGHIRTLLPSTGGLLGIDAAGEVPMGQATILESGELVFLFTDGIVEAFSTEGDSFGMNRTLEVVQLHVHETPDEIISALFAAIDTFSERQRHDDMTAVMIKAA